MALVNLSGQDHRRPRFRNLGPRKSRYYDVSRRQISSRSRSSNLDKDARWASATSSSVQLFDQFTLLPLARSRSRVVQAITGSAVSGGRARSASTNRSSLSLSSTTVALVPPPLIVLMVALITRIDKIHSTESRAASIPGIGIQKNDTTSLSGTHWRTSCRSLSVSFPTTRALGWSNVTGTGGRLRDRAAHQSMVSQSVGHKASADLAAIRPRITSARWR